MRRILLGLSMALLAFSIGIMFVRGGKRSSVIPHSSSVGWSSSDGKRVVHRHSVLSSPSAAAEEFNTQLQAAAEYIEFTPCFDTGGRRIGERVVILLLPPYATEATWRIMWTQQAEDFSELFWVESPSLADARFYETPDQQGWKRCVARR